VTLESSGIDRPAKLDGCVYASYGARCGRRNWGTQVARADPHVFPARSAWRWSRKRAPRRYEVATLKQMIVNDGGSGSFVETSPGMLSVWDTLLTVRKLMQSWVKLIVE